MNNFLSKNSGKRIIVLLLIIFAVICFVQYINYYVKKEKAKNFQADILLVQAKVEIVKTNNDMNKEENPLKGFILAELPENIDIKQFLEKNVIAEEEYAKYYLLDSSSLEQMGLQDLVNKYKGYFIVNYENFEVVYTEGYENENGLWVYRLTDLHKQPENNKKKDEIVEQPNEQTEEQSTEQPAEEKQTEENKE